MRLRRPLTPPQRWLTAVGLTCLAHGVMLGALTDRPVNHVSPSSSTPPKHLTRVHFEGRAPTAMQALEPLAAAPPAHPPRRSKRLSAVTPPSQDIDIEPSGPTTETTSSPASEPAGPPHSALSANEQEAVRALAAGMTPPSCDQSSPPITPPPAAVAARVFGDMRVQCHVMADGSVEHCRVTKALPHMSQAVLDAASQWRCTPAQLEGRPISVDVAFSVLIEQ